MSSFGSGAKQSLLDTINGVVNDASLVHTRRVFPTVSLTGKEDKQSTARSPEDTQASGRILFFWASGVQQSREQEEKLEIAGHGSIVRNPWAASLALYLFSTAILAFTNVRGPGEPEQEIRYIAVLAALVMAVVAFCWRLYLAYW